MEKEFNTFEIMQNAKNSNIELDGLYLWLITSYIISKNLMNGYDLRTLYLKILLFMKENNETENSQFFEYLKKSKALRGKTIDYELIQKDYEKESKEWESIYKSLDFIKPKEERED